MTGHIDVNPQVGNPQNSGRGRPPSSTSPLSGAKVTALTLLVLGFAISRIAIYASGVRYDSSGLRTNLQQLLDPKLLRSDLVSSVWHLQSQPPGFNLLSGVLLKLPNGLATLLMVALWIGMGLLIVIATFSLLTELSVPVWPAFAIVLVFIVLSPAYWLYENLYLYTYPTVALLTIAFLALLRFLRSGKAPWGVTAFGSFASIVLLNSHYQIVWLVLVGAALIVTLRSRWQQVCKVASIPLLIVAALYFKNYLLFGTTNTSSWLGMNLAQATLERVPPSELKELVANRTLTPIAELRSFGPPKEYRFVAGPLPKPGTSALDELYKSTGYINFNNLIYVKVSDKYLHDDVAFIRARPGVYVDSVIVASQLWSTPADNAFVGGPVSKRSLQHINSYATDYDHVVDLQPTSDPIALYLIISFPFARGTIPANYLAYTIILVDLLALGGLPILAGRRWRSDPALAGFCLALWITIAYAFAVTTLLELGENARFSFELGPIPLIAATLVITNLCRALRGSTLGDERAHRPPVTASSTPFRQ